MNSVGRKSHCKYFARVYAAKGYIELKQRNAIIEMVDSNLEEDLVLAEVIIESFKDRYFKDSVRVIDGLFEQIKKD